MDFDWEVRKAEVNYKKHGVRFPEALAVFEDDFAITVTDQSPIPVSCVLYPGHGRKRTAAGGGLYIPKQ